MHLTKISGKFYFQSCHILLEKIFSFPGMEWAISCAAANMSHRGVDHGLCRCLSPNTCDNPLRRSYCPFQRFIFSQYCQGRQEIYLCLKWIWHSLHSSVYYYNIPTSTSHYIHICNFFLFFFIFSQKQLRAPSNICTCTLTTKLSQLDTIDS